MPSATGEQDERINRYDLASLLASGAATFTRFATGEYAGSRTPALNPGEELPTWAARRNARPVPGLAQFSSSPRS